MSRRISFMTKHSLVLADGGKESEMVKDEYDVLILLDLPKLKDGDPLQALGRELLGQARALYANEFNDHPKQAARHVIVGIAAVAGLGRGRDQSAKNHRVRVLRARGLSYGAIAKIIFGSAYDGADGAQKAVMRNEVKQRARVRRRSRRQSKPKDV